MAPPIRRRLLLVLLLPVLAVAALPAAAAAASCRAWLVQSIPTDMPHLRRVPGVLSTGMLPSVVCDVERWREGVTFDVLQLSVCNRVNLRMEMWSVYWGKMSHLLSVLG
jgi:hypothetical protein